VVDQQRSRLTRLILDDERTRTGVDRLAAMQGYLDQKHGAHSIIDAWYRAAVDVFATLVAQYRDS